MQRDTKFLMKQKPLFQWQNNNCSGLFLCTEEKLGRYGALILTSPL